jgi:hypothetical protein
MNRKGRCVHYNGTVNECCEAGVKYSDLTVRGALPCHGADYESGLRGKPLPIPETVALCSKRCEPTQEQIDADEKKSEELFERTMKARKAIVDFLGGPWKKGMRAVSGTLPCPCCQKGTLTFSRGGNGHIHASCFTEDCVSWME